MADLISYRSLNIAITSLQNSAKGFEKSGVSRLLKTFPKIDPQIIFGKSLKYETPP